MKPLSVVSYLGVPLFDTAGEIMGHLAVLDTKPMPRSRGSFHCSKSSPRARPLNAVASRPSSKSGRARSNCRLLDSAMDAVLVLDARGLIKRVNPAAEQLFGCTGEDLLGENLRAFLPPESAAQLDAFVKELESQREGSRQLWIPQSFPVQRWDKSTFPAEATLSRFTNRGRFLHCDPAQRRRAPGGGAPHRAADRRDGVSARNARGRGMGEMLGQSAA